MAEPNVSNIKVFSILILSFLAMTYASCIKTDEIAATPVLIAKNNGKSNTSQFPSPRLTMYALVNPAKSIMLATIKSHKTNFLGLIK
jgi:hypothetical protein